MSRTWGTKYDATKVASPILQALWNASILCKIYYYSGIIIIIIIIINIIISALRSSRVNSG